MPGCCNPTQYLMKSALNVRGRGWQTAFVLDLTVRCPLLCVWTAVPSSVRRTGIFTCVFIQFNACSLNTCRGRGQRAPGSPCAHVQNGFLAPGNLFWGPANMGSLGSSSCRPRHAGRSWALVPARGPVQPPALSEPRAVAQMSPSVVTLLPRPRPHASSAPWQGSTFVTPPPLCAMTRGPPVPGRPSWR